MVSPDPNIKKHTGSNCVATGDVNSNGSCWCGNIRRILRGVTTFQDIIDQNRAKVRLERKAAKRTYTFNELLKESGVRL